MSSYFNAGSNRIEAGTTARANDVNSLRDEIGSGFDMLPTPTEIKTGVEVYCGISGGSANAQTVSMPYTLTAYAAGVYIVWKSGFDNTDAVTINVDSLGVKSLVNQDGSELVAGDLVQYSIYGAWYNDTSGKFHLIGAAKGLFDIAVAAAQAAQAAQAAAEAAQAAAEVAQAAAEAAQVSAETAQTAAETAQTGAETAQTAAETAQTAAELALDEFTDIYLGAKASDPATDNDGNALQDGAIYYNTTSNVIRVYDLGTTSWSTFASAVPDVFQWDTTIRTGNFNASVLTGYSVNTSGGAVVVSLPAGSDGDLIGVADVGGAAATNNIEISPNGTEVIMDGAAGESLFINLNRRAVQLLYSSPLAKWAMVDN